MKARILYAKSKKHLHGIIIAFPGSENLPIKTMVLYHNTVSNSKINLSKIIWDHYVRTRDDALRINFEDFLSVY